MEKKKAKFKRGQQVYADGFGEGVVLDSYKVKGEYLYHIQQDEFTMGNIPEDFIRVLNH